MSRIVYAWELGEHLGHVGPFLPVMRALEAQGHDVLLAVREPAACARLLGGKGNWVQAPFAPDLPRPTSPLNYSGILECFGYDDPVTLTGLLAAWRQLLWLAQPQLLIADHAPGAMLAARSLGIPVMLFGTGFTAPPRLDPLPGMRPWQPVPAAACAAVDRRVLGAINQALTTLGTPPLGRLSELFAVAEDGLLTLPELDHYPERGPTRYWGLLPPADGGHHLDWPAGQGPRIFAYLRASHPLYAAALQALANSGCPVVACLPDHEATTPPAPNIAFSRHPLDLRRYRAEADLAVLYGGAATTATFLLAGKPVLCLPAHLEQSLTAWRIAALGAGVCVMPDAEPQALARALDPLLHDPEPGRRARAFAARHAGNPAETTVTRLVGRIGQLLGN